LHINLPVFAFGERAAQILHKSDDKLPKLRTAQIGSCTFHPRTVAAQPELFRKPTWTDLQALQQKIGVN